MNKEEIVELKDNLYNEINSYIDKNKIFELGDVVQYNIIPNNRYYIIGIGWREKDIVYYANRIKKDGSLSYFSISPIPVYGDELTKSSAQRKVQINGIKKKYAWSKFEKVTDFDFHNRYVINI